jgi:hypothetical protein
MSGPFKVEVVEQIPLRKFYLALGNVLGTRVPQTLLVLTEEEAEIYRREACLIEIGEAHSDLALGIVWEVTGIRRADIADLPDYPCKKRDSHEVDSGLRSGQGRNS